MKKDVLLAQKLFFSYSLLHAARISPCRFIDPLHSIQFLALARVLLLQTHLTRPIDFAGLKDFSSLFPLFPLTYMYPYAVNVPFVRSLVRM
jgi:hypothetical protein